MEGMLLLGSEFSLRTKSSSNRQWNITVEFADLSLRNTHKGVWHALSFS